MDEELSKYRDSLQQTVTLLNTSYDKLLVTLSGGSLALSIAFLKDVIHLESAVYPELILFSWLAFIASLASVLGRIMFGIESHKYAIKQVDKEKIYSETPGGPLSLITRAFHILSAIMLLLGLVLISSFTYFNIGG